MKILVINCGSSSLKFQVIDAVTEELLAKGLCERIGIDGSITYENVKDGTGKETSNPAIPDHNVAISLVIDALMNDKTGVIKSLDEIGAVGHRIVHGGEAFTSSVVINDEVIQAIKDVSDLAPLHNPANLIGVAACQKLMPGTPMVAVFDTAFHQTMPSKAYMYALPLSYYEDYKIRRYGLIMGTRSGDLDPAIVEFIANKENKTASEVLNVLNKKSGVFALSGEFSSDFRDLESAYKNGDKNAQLAVDAFAYRVAKYVGAYTAAMNGVDVIAFTAGIGENSPFVREKVLSYLGYLGIEYDPAANAQRGDVVKISTDSSKVAVYAIATNEELAIARETYALCK